MTTTTMTTTTMTIQATAVTRLVRPSPLPSSVSSPPFQNLALGRHMRASSTPPRCFAAREANACVQNETVAPSSSTMLRKLNTRDFTRESSTQDMTLHKDPPPAYTPTNEDTTQMRAKIRPRTRERGGRHWRSTWPAQAAPVGPPPEYTPRHPSSVESNASSEANTEDATKIRPQAKMLREVPKKCLMYLHNP